MATINLGAIKFNWQGAYNGATAYAIDDVVSSGGSSYICIAATTGNAPPNATYWEQMSSAGTDGTDLTTTLTTQGDLVYRDASGLQRLGAGTSGQVLQTGGTGANPSWTTVSGDLSNSGATQNVWKSNFSTAFDTNSTSFVDTGLELSGFSALSADTDFIVYFTEARREADWNQTSGLHLYSTDNGSTWNNLNQTMNDHDTAGTSLPESQSYWTATGTYYLSFTSGQTPRFKVQGKRFGSSNNYYLNNSHTKSSIIAVKVNP